MSTVPQLMDEALRKGTFVALTLARPASRELPPRQDVRPVELKTGPALQWTTQVGRQAVHRNLAFGDSVAQLEELLGSSYRDAHLFTTEQDVVARASRRGKLSVRRQPPSRAAAGPGHDRTKQHLLPEGQPIDFLVAVGVMTKEGRVKAQRRSKFKQINRFAEMVDDVLEQLPRRPLRIVDSGCGKSYLTFALHELLRRRDRPATIVGLDVDPGVVETCQGIVDDLGLAGLSFRVGRIEDHEPDGPIDLAVSLHACDTATDDALAVAARWQARAILAVPCCQHELAPQLDSDALQALLGHGLFRERLGALATDALRAAALEAVGYRTQVLEFVDLEHTPKNLLLRAVRHDDPRRRAEHRARYDALKAQLGLGAIRLDEGLLSVAPAAQAPAG